MGLGIGIGAGIGIGDGDGEGFGAGVGAGAGVGPGGKLLSVLVDVPLTTESLEVLKRPQLLKPKIRRRLSGTISKINLVFPM